MSAIRKVLTEELESGAYITTMMIDDHEVFVYQPKDKMESDIINYSFSCINNCCDG